MFLKNHEEHPLEKEFVKFMTQHQRSFGTKAEYKFRRDLFAKKYAELEEFNN